MRKVLAIHPDPDMLDLMASFLAEKFPDVVTETVRNEAAATSHCRAQVDDPFRMVIANYSIAEDFHKPRNEMEDRGMAFLESLQTLGHGDVRKILITPTANARLFTRVQALPRCYLLVIEDPSKFAERFLEAATHGLEAASEDAPDELRKQVKVVVSLNLEKQLWDYQLKGIGFTYVPPPKPLQVDPTALKRLIDRSKVAGRHPYPDWQTELLTVGQDLGTLLFYGNPDFLGDLREAQTKAGGAENKSICFSIEKSVHPMALEALTHPKEERFWMLQVPMYRRLIRAGQAAMERPPLFTGTKRRTEPFTALVIESPAEGVIERLTDQRGRRLDLNALANVAEEAQDVESALRKVASRVERISPKEIPPERSFKNYLQERLRAERWDLVHYAGHSYYDEGAGKAYLFFPGAFAEELDIEVFNTWLDHAGTRFLYLSGCQSSEAGFVFELARLQIPGVLGFRWPIDDRAALAFACRFYDNLFAGNGAPCLERAFLSTRCAMQSEHEDNKIWAAAMLIMQDTD